MMAPRDNVIWLTQQLPRASVSGKASTHENSTFHFHTSRADAQMRGFRFRLPRTMPSGVVAKQYSMTRSGILIQHEAVQQGKVVQAVGSLHAMALFLRQLLLLTKLWQQIKSANQGP